MERPTRKGDPVSFTVQPQRRDDFIRLARKTARDSLANEPGSRRFEVIADEQNPDLVYLNEVYADSPPRASGVGSRARPDELGGRVLLPGRGEARPPSRPGWRASRS
jgi:hypothetical protein